MTCTCCREWRVEAVTLDDIPRLKLSCRGYLVGYYTSPESIATVLAAQGGPTLDRFTATPETTTAA